MNASDVVFVDPLNVPDWNVAVETLPGRTFCHRTAWPALLQRTYRFIPRYCVWEQPLSMETVIPLMEVNSLWTGRRAVSLPFIDFCAPGSRSEDGVVHAVEAIRRLALARQWRSVEFRSDRYSSAGLQPGRSYFQHTLDLTGGVESCARRARPEALRAVRKAEKNSVRIRQANNEGDMPAFYHLQTLTRRRHGLPPQPFVFFRNLYREVIAKGFGRLFLATHEDRPIAGAVFLEDSPGAIFKYGASDPRCFGFRANNLVMWTAIRWYAENRFSSLCMGRTSVLNDGLCRFKRSWGAVEHIVRYSVAQLAPPRRLSPAAPTGTWVNSLMRRVPLPLLRGIGAAVYRHMA